MEILNTRVIRITAGQYTSQDGKWNITGSGRQWYVFRKNELWGEWESELDWKEYSPFTSLREAIDTIDEYEWRGLV